MSEDAQSTRAAPDASADAYSTPAAPDASADAYSTPAAPDASADAQRLQELESLSTQQLHDRAIHRAEKHLDVKFFWELLETIPAAEAVAGDLGEADFDIVSARGQINDALHSDEGRLGEALRPVFIDYLLEHPDA